MKSLVVLSLLVVHTAATECSDLQKQQIRDDPELCQTKTFKAACKEECAGTCSEGEAGGGSKATKSSFSWLWDVMGYTPEYYLAVAAQNGDVEKIRELIAEGNIPNIDHKDNTTNVTPLVFAAAKGKVEAMKLLLENGADPAVVTQPDGFTTLMHATTSGEVAAVELLLNTGKVDISHADAQGSTALMIAANEGFVECFELLLAKCSTEDMNAQDNGGWSALIYASALNRVEIVKMLLNKEGIENKKTKAGRNAPMMAHQKNYTEILQLFEDYVNRLQQKYTNVQVGSKGGAKISSKSPTPGAKLGNSKKKEGGGELTEAGQKANEAQEAEVEAYWKKHGL